jgi:hypothetical protein
VLRLVLLAAVVLLTIAWIRARSGGAENAGPRAPIGSLEADRQTLRALRDAGADLTKATEVNFYLYFPSQAAADSAAAQATTPELPTQVKRAADGSAWLCLVSGEMVPTEEAIHAASTRLQAVAVAHGGEYDGWEAAVTQ